MRAVIFIHVLYLILIKTFTVKGVSKCESKVELRAVLLSCPVKDSGCDDDDPLSQAMKAEEFQILQADPSNCEKIKEDKSREFPCEVRDCKRKLVITIKIKNAGKIPCEDEYIVVDHVFDPLTGGRGRLLSPVVIKLRQEQMVQLYGLQFQRVVNSDPFEEQKPCDTTCSIDPKNPSCGIAMYDGKPIPFSEGFCCSCDPHVNAKRQLSPLSRGDSFPFRDTKVVYQGNGPFPGEPNAIYNPELVKLKSGIPSDGATKESDGSEILDALFSDKIPNFLLEVDRKIVCDKGDFMKELCLLRDNKGVTSKVDLRKNSALEDFDLSGNEAGEGSEIMPFLAREEQTTVAFDVKAEQQSNSNLEKNTVELQNFIKSLNLERASTQEPLSNVVRGKRENRRENKKLTLEEKLNRFISSKNHMTGRRKRLMEISHRRFRKADNRRQFVEDVGVVADNCKSPPPRYFFSHDRAIIDPLESLDPGSNVTCTLKENVYEYTKNRELEPGKNQNCRRFKGKDAMLDRSFYQLKGENKRKEKYFGGKVGLKKEKGNEEEGSERGEKKLRKEEESKLEEKDEIILPREHDKDQSSQFSAKSFKTFLYKTDRERTSEKSKLKHFFSVRNREKDKSEFNKRKMGESESSANAKYKNQVTDKVNRVEETAAEAKEKEDKEAKEQEEDGSWENLQLSTEKTSFLKQPNEGLEERSAELKNSARRYGRPFFNGHYFRSRDPIGNVDFKIKIIRNKGPPIYQRSHYPMYEDTYSGKGRGDYYNRYGANPYATTYSKQQRNKQNPFLPYIPNHKYYLYEKQRKHPDTYVLRKSSAVQNHQRYRMEKRKDPGEYPKNSRTLQDEDGYGNKKPNRGHFLPGEEYPDEKPYSAKWSDGDGYQDAHSRGKRYSEVQQTIEETDESQKCENIKNKRSASYTFQPAKGFFESELESQKPEGRVIHELETCGKRRSCQISRLKSDNLSTDANAISLNSPVPGLAKRNVKLPSNKQRLIQSYLKAPDYVLEGVEGAAKGKRETPDTRKMKPLHENPSFECADPQETAHCMRFGDLWYSLYTIKKPMISQIVGVQLFDKHVVGEGTEWRDLTKGKMIRIGTFLGKAEDELPSVSVTFSGERTGRPKNTIDPDNYFLLIPSHVSDASKAGFYPQLDGGPSEYLLVPSEEISSGGECNRIGTSFEAFARQPDRCRQQRGSCLKRQPVDLWREDMEARIRGKRGKYFVENFGNIPNSPIKSYTNLTGEFLALEYYGEYTSTIEIEVKADSNAIIRKGSIAQIPLVYIDSTYPKKTRIILSILNTGLTSSNFRPRLGDCPPDLDVAWCPLEGPLVTIPPQQRHDFKLDLSGSLPTKEILLTVQVLNQVNKEVALRKIIIKKEHRCVCAFHCKCSCIGSSKDGRTCRKLSEEEYRKAGYIGPYPFRGGAANYSSSGSTWKYIHTILITTGSLLLTFGVVKGILGLFIRRIGIAGVRVITGPRSLSSYYESELKGCTVLCDECGFPVHPTTCRPVQIVPLFIEMFLNFLFFFLYPLRGIWFLVVSLACCSSFYSDCDSCCRRDDADNDHKLSRPLLSREPDPTFVHYNLTAINQKKSRHEYLPYPAYKGDDDPLEEDDTEFVLQEMKRYRKK